mgnify:CR=1 FL=1
MSIEDKLSKYVKFPDNKVWLNKFVLVNLEGENYLSVGNHYDTEEHSNILAQLAESKKLSFDKTSRALEGEGYKILSMGLCNIDVRKKIAYFFGQSVQYSIDVTDEGIEIIKGLLPDWSVRYHK